MQKYSDTIVLQVVFAQFGTHISLSMLSSKEFYDHILHYTTQECNLLQRPVNCNIWVFLCCFLLYCFGYMGKKIQILSSIRWCYRKMLATQECDLLQRPVNCNIWFSLCCFLLYFFGYMGKKIQILSSIRWCYRKMLEVIENILILTSVIDNLINCHLHMIVSFFDAARREWIILGSNGEMPSHP